MVVAAQLQTHLDEAGLMTAFQSAKRKHHSTESALLNIHNDILLNMALTLLDLSTAFNTIDHTILLDRLNGYYGISELALCWFNSYLLGRTHSVKVGSTLSHPVALQYGVPQGSVLGPFFFHSTPTQSAPSFNLTVALIFISTLMTPSYTFHSLQQIFLTVYKN